MDEWLATMGPAVANHLWQSTAFAVVAAGLALALKKNQARARYWVWMAASVKFVVPFALLMGLGGMLPRPQHAVVTMPVYSAVDEVGLPFDEVQGIGIREQGTEDRGQGSGIREEQKKLTWPVALAGIWICGVVVVLGVWCRGWLKVMRTLRRAVRAAGGREVELLRRVERNAGGRVRLVLSRESMEPGIFGVWRPVLIWPEGLSARLDDEQVEAILAHELAHARRRDNLTAALHMLVEAAFWFHPLVWWVGARLVEERERACDEAVVEMGSRPGVYAESLLKAVRFCVESPLKCVAGVTGADLKQRVRGIMTARLKRLGLTGKLALAAFALVAIAGPVGFGVVRMIPMYGQIPDAAGPLPAFEVAAIKPSDPERRGMGFTTNGRHFSTLNTTASDLVQYAYGIQARQIVGAPAWVDVDKFDIAAVASEGGSGDPKWNLMVRKLLADRFGLTFHHDTRELPVYELQIGKNGAKLAKSATDADHSELYFSRTSKSSAGTTVHAKAATMAGLASLLQVGLLERPVVDRTGLTGTFDFTLDFTADTAKGGGTAAESEDMNAPAGIFTAIQEELGLKLVAGKAPADVIVIDHIAKPVPDSAASTAVKALEVAAKEVRQILEPQGVSPPSSFRAHLLPVGQNTGSAAGQAGTVTPNPTRDDDAVTNGAPSGAAIPAGGDQRQELHGVYKVWLDQDVRWVITDQEAEAFKRLTNDEERDRFIEQFWQRRNPNPDSPDNAYRDEIYARIAYANEHFASGQPGWMTDRGHVYIAYGKPDEIDVQPADGTVIWRYRHIPGVGDNVVLKFGDGGRKGDYRLMTPWPLPQGTGNREQGAAGVETPNPLKRRLSDAAFMGGAQVQGTENREQGTAGASAKFEVAAIKLLKPGAEQGRAGEGLLRTRAMSGAMIGWMGEATPRGTTAAGPPSDRWHMVVDTRNLIAIAYGLSGSAESRIVGGPAWLKSDVYDFEAKIDDATVAAMQAMTPAQRVQETRLMEQALLADRFGLKAHFETREMPEYALVVAKGGPKLTPSKDGERPGFKWRSGQGGEMTVTVETMDQWARSPLLGDAVGGRPVVNQTGLTGTYDITLKWGPDQPAEGGDQDVAEPPLLTAIQQQLGLKLVETKGPVEVLVIDSVERPGEN
ncbi:MAG: TIGR03435 family protein [Acidobacteriaceae bacterium]|jgi:uncharacterized protein (TIGR03435 family)